MLMLILKTKNINKVYWPEVPYLHLCNTHFFCQNEHVKLGVRIIHGVLYYLVKQRKILSEIWRCVLHTGAYYTRVNTVNQTRHNQGNLLLWPYCCHFCEPFNNFEVGFFHFLKNGYLYHLTCLCGWSSIFKDNLFDFKWYRSLFVYSQTIEKTLVFCSLDKAKYRWTQAFHPSWLPFLPQSLHQ